MFNAAKRVHNHKQHKGRNNYDPQKLNIDSRPVCDWEPFQDDKVRDRNRPDRAPVLFANQAMRDKWLKGMHGNKFNKRARAQQTISALEGNGLG